MQVRDLLDDVPMSQDSVIPLEMKQLLQCFAIKAIPDHLPTEFSPQNNNQS